jgi:hypothetical protein
LVELEKQFKEIVTRFPGTMAAYEAQPQWRDITDSTVSGETEKVQVPGTPFLSLISFKNIKQFYYRIIPLDQDNPLMQRTEQYWENLASQTSLRNVKVSLPDPGDHREHSVEVGIDELPIGRYALLGSVSPVFTTKHNALFVQYFNVSAIAYIHNKDGLFFSRSGNR